MKLFLILSILLYHQYKQSGEIEIGKPLPNNIKIIDSSKYKIQIISAGSALPFIEVRIHNVNYNVGLTNEKNVLFVITFDRSFVSKEGFSIGTTYKEVKRKYKLKGQFEPGIGYHFKLISGWDILFSDEKILTGEKVSDTAHIKNFFKRDFRNE